MYNAVLMNERYRKYKEQQLRAEITRRELAKILVLGGLSFLGGWALRGNLTIPQSSDLSFSENLEEQKKKEIELVRKTQQEALTRGEIKIPLPITATYPRVKIEEIDNKEQDSSSIRIQYSPRTSSVFYPFPSPVDGTVIKVGELEANNPIYFVVLQRIEKIFIFKYGHQAFDSTLNEGDKVSMGQSLFTLNLLGYEGTEGIKGAFVSIEAGDIANFSYEQTGPILKNSKISKENIMKDSKGDYLTIPTLFGKPSKVA